MKKIKNYLKPFGLLIIYLLAQLFLQAIFLSFGIDDATITMVALIAIDIISLLVVVYFVRNDLKGQAANFKCHSKEYIGCALEHWLLGFFGMMITNALVIAINGATAPNEEANRMLMEFVPYSVLVLCICAPIAEELLFRLNFRKSIKNDKVFLWVSALLFGTMHIVGTYEGIKDLLYVIPYSILGYQFAKIYVKTDNIYASIFAHSLHNAIVTLLFYTGL